MKRIGYIAFFLPGIIYREEGIRALLDQVHSIRNKLDSEQHSNKRSRTTITSSEEESTADDTSHMIVSIKILQLYLNDKHAENNKLTQQLSDSNQKVLDLKQLLQQQQKSDSDSTIADLNKRINDLTSELAASGRVDMTVYDGEEVTDYEAACRELDGLRTKFNNMTIAHDQLKTSHDLSKISEATWRNNIVPNLREEKRRSQAQLDRMKKHNDFLQGHNAELGRMCDDLSLPNEIVRLKLSNEERGERGR